MKPLVYLIDKNETDDILISYKELIAMLNEVYQAGFYDGQSYKGNMSISSTTPCVVPDSFDQWTTAHSSDCKSNAQHDYSCNVTGSVNACVTEAIPKY